MHQRMAGHCSRHDAQSHDEVFFVELIGRIALMMCGKPLQSVDFSGLQQ